MEIVFSTQRPPKERPLPSFIKKLLLIIADESSQEYIFWIDNGQVICIPNAVSFSQMILPKFFKHRNWQSFVRQLNLYGFRKVYQLNLTYDNSLEKKTVWQFKHESFQKDHPEKLTEIKRRTAKASQEIPSIPTSLPLITTTTDAAAATTDAAASTTTTTEIVQDDTLEEELNKMKLKIQRVDRRRQDLADQVLELSEILTKQKKTIHIFMQLLEKTPDLMVNNTRHPNTIQHLPNQNILDTGDFEDEDEEEDYSTSNLHLPAPRYHPHLPPPFPQQPYNHSPSLPSISSLIHGIQESNMPPPMKRLKKH